MGFAPEANPGNNAAERKSETITRETPLHPPRITLRFVMALIYLRLLSNSELLTEFLLDFARANLPQSGSALQPNVAVGVIAL